MSCIGDNTLAALVDGRLSVEERRKVDEHLDQCEVCRGLVAALAPKAAEVAEDDATVRDLRSPVPQRLDSLTNLHVRLSSREPLLRPGLLFEHYEIVRRVGKGGMGEVYLARDLKLARKVALKVISPGLFDSPEALARFHHEARVMARLSHPNIVTVHTVGAFRNMPYVAMEYVEGDSLADRLEEGPLSESESLEIALRVAEGLSAAHERGVIHRDLKPANVMLGSDGRVRVLDFGLARISHATIEDAPTHVPTMVKSTDPLAAFDLQDGGTPAYMAPEQWDGLSGRDANPAAIDVWALGVLLHELITGETPFERAANMVQLAAMVQDGGPRVSSTAPISPSVKLLLERCMLRDPTHRPPLDTVRQNLVRLHASVVASDPGEAETLPAARVPSTAEILAAGQSLAGEGSSPNHPPVPRGPIASVAPAPTPAAMPRWLPLVIALLVGGVAGALGVSAAMRRGEAPPPDTTSP